ncbi:MAG: bifunctional phosphoribosyl-AMP cyclohydrolase/phosphoribosyl-ATP diphosphatase HisIE [Flavobacteriales bacterium]|nr:bifunctional phosphoribosyl-AMP cyclohydrolase/phosphoribosyl-ATP diphosphatase HisIE [Flavobacteriales bacterium]
MQIDFTKNDGLVPVIVQNTLTLQVLMLGYMNQEAFDLTKDKGLVTFYSRSKQRIWMKGETSNNTLKVDEIQLDCDRDTLLIKATPNGVTCHTGATSCFKEETSKGFLYELEKTIHDRIDQDDENSYTNKLFKRGVNKVAQKVGEEAVEVVIEAKDHNDDLFKNEVADLTYHLLILLKYKKMTFEDIEQILKDRASK